MICFTVMDHDVLTSDDFAGEAFLSLATIPGVALASPADNFHGLKPVELPLMHQKNKSISIFPSESILSISVVSSVGVRLDLFTSGYFLNVGR